MAWILSENCSILNHIQKQSLLGKIVNIENIGTISNIYTEHKNIDILIETINEFLVIENKLKSSQKPGQLDKYQKIMEKIRGPKATHYIFLTLVKEKAVLPWINFSYLELVKIIDDFKLETGTSSDDIIFFEYYAYLKKITAVVEAFLQNPAVHKNVFTDGHLSKFEKKQLAYSGYNKFICDRR